MGRFDEESRSGDPFEVCVRKIHLCAFLTHGRQAGRQADTQRDRVENNKTRQRIAAAALIIGCKLQIRNQKNCHRHLCFSLLLSFVFSGGDGEKERHASFAHEMCILKFKK